MAFMNMESHQGTREHGTTSNIEKKMSKSEVSFVIKNVVALKWFFPVVVKQFCS